MAQLELDGVFKRFGTYEVIRNLTLSIADGDPSMKLSVKQINC